MKNQSSWGETESEVSELRLFFTPRSHKLRELLGFCCSSSEETRCGLDVPAASVRATVKGPQPREDRCLLLISYSP